MTGADREKLLARIKALFSKRLEPAPPKPKNLRPLRRRES
jgi:hypothetical protein